MLSPLATAGTLKNDPGITMCDTLVNVPRGRKVPLLVVNDTVAPKVFSNKSTIATAERVSNVMNDKEVLSGQEVEIDLQAHVDKLEIEENQKQLLLEILKKHKDLFAKTDHDLGKTHIVEMDIDTGDNSPVRQRPYRCALTQRATIDKHIDAMLSANIIRSSTSPWASPVVIVPKKDGSLRFCIDFRAVNGKTLKNSYPLPNIDDIFTSLGKAKYVTCLDLKSGYWQIAMKEGDKQKTAFVSHRGLHEFNVMPFGLSNAPSVFQDLMNHVLQNIQNFAIAYIDDILIFSETYEDHIKHIEEVFRRLANAGLKLKLSKCEFLKERVKYLGHIISPNGIAPDPDKISSIRNMPAPRTIREVRSFLGAVGYYMKFIDNFADIARPLTRLTKKNSRFEWTEDSQLAFQTLKQKLCTAPVLAYPNIELPYNLYTDASQYAVGAILTRETAEGERVIQYLSHKLNPGQQKWPTIEREGYAIIYAISKFRHYLYGAQFTIYTDHKPLKSLFTADMKNTRIQRWAIMLEEYNCDIQYKPGKQNLAADMMSRLHNDPADVGSEADVMLIDSDQPNYDEDNLLVDPQLPRNKLKATQYETIRDILPPQSELLQLQANDKHCLAVRKSIELETSAANIQDYVLMDDMLYHISTPVRLDPEQHLQVVIPQILVPLILKAYHNDAGHLGIDKTYDKIRSRYFWPNMYKDVVNHLQKCDPCNSRKLRKQQAPLGDMPMPKYPFEIVGIDTCGPYIESGDGNRYVIVIMDHYSGWPEAFATSDKSAKTVAQILLEDNSSTGKINRARLQTLM